MSSKTRFAVTAIGMLVGTAVLLLFTKITKDILFDGLNFCSSSSSELLLGSSALIGSAIVTGFLASLLVVRDNIFPHYLISTVIVGKMLVVLSCLPGSAPFFYEVAVHLGMVGGVWLGHYSAMKFPLAPV